MDQKHRENGSSAVRKGLVLMGWYTNTHPAPIVMTCREGGADPNTTPANSACAGGGAGVHPTPAILLSTGGAPRGRVTPVGY